jgi:predicted enzyme related to lactoylglutathione lyase
MAVKSICGVILAARDPAALATFYSEALGLAFEREDHGGLDAHFGVDVGSIHFGIHPPGNLHQDSVGNASVNLTFDVQSLHDVAARLKRLKASELAAPHDEGFGLVAAYQDPEGNAFEIVELRYEFGKS